MDHNRLSLFDVYRERAERSGKSRASAYNTLNEKEGYLEIVFQGHPSQKPKKLSSAKPEKTMKAGINYEDPE
jgi:ABC-type uncharacterized transport system YnjBCD substrate-binding protein